MRKWRWLAAYAAMLPQAAPAATDGGPILHLHEQGADFSVTGGAATENGPGIKGEANLSLGLADVTTNIKGTVNTGGLETRETGGAEWSGGTMSVETRWSRGGTSLNLDASRKFGHSIHDGTAAGALLFSHVEQQTDEKNARAGAHFQPLDTVSLDLGAAAGNELTEQSQRQPGLLRNTNRVETETGREFAQASWSPIPAVTLKAETAAVSTTMRLHGVVNGKTSYRAMEPKLTMALKPWHGGDISLGVEKTTIPLDPANFAAYAAATGRPEDASLKPDSATAFHTSLKQTFGPLLSLDTTYRTASIDSTTVLMPAGIGQTPLSIAGGRQQSVSTDLSLSLASLGLPKTSIVSNTVWRRSRIRDPLTGSDRGLSGEAPHDASLGLTQHMPLRHLTWGIAGHLGAETHYYQATEETDVTNSGSFGVFLQYDPGPFSLHLNVDGLAGNTVQTDEFYAGTRASGLIDHSIRHDTGGPTVGLTLTTATGGG